MKIGNHTALVMAWGVGVFSGVADAQPRMVISEWMYSGSSPAGGEFVEFTNIGDVPIDLTGWSFDDSGRQAGSFVLAGVIGPGDSLILTEDDADDYRAAWSLGPEVVVLGGLGNPNGNNLGRNDEINLYDAQGQLVDRLTYGDEAFPGSVRTQRVSGSPLALLAVGSNNVLDWGGAHVGDAQDSRVSSFGDVGNPGTFRLPSGHPIPGLVDASHDSGFFTAPIAVTLQSSGGVIRFTTDGSEPTTSSPVYVGPITVADRTPEPNYLSHIQSAPDEGWLLPAGNIFKATVLRFAAFNQDGVAGPTTTRTYIVHPSGPARFTLPVVSIVTEEESFFDYFRGIYVPGAIYDKFFDPSIDHWNREANYTQRGDEWERRAQMTFFEPDGTLGFDLGVGVRIHGGSSRSNRRKSIRIYARSEYGQSSIVYPIFPDESVQEFKRLILRNGGNDSGRVLFRDAYIQDLVKDTGVATQGNRPCIVLLNGEYWGIHVIRQRYDNRFLEFNKGADPENVDLLTGPGAEVEEGDTLHYWESVNMVYNLNMADPHSYEIVQDRFDMENFITYTAIQLFIANTDWPQNNIDYWRPRVDGGRWRWLLYDTDLSFYATTQSHGPTTNAVSRILSGTVSPHSRMFQRLMANQDFRTEFLNRSADLMNQEFAVPNMLSKLEDFRLLFAPEMPEHISRWRSPLSFAAWNDSAMYWMRAFINNRAVHHRSHLAAAFGVPGTSALTVRIPMGLEERGRLFVNRIELSSDEGDWSGVYFDTVPVVLRGEAAPGYRFVGFEEIADAPVDGRVTWIPDTDLTLTPLFLCVADYDGNGAVNFFDIAAYLSAFTAGDPGADLAAPFGVLNFFDLAAYLQAFNGGCP